MEYNKEIDLTRFSEMVARQREFMSFVAQKYPEIYKEFCEIEKKQDEEFELLRKALNKGDKS
jgi:hypothetical protein